MTRAGQPVALWRWPVVALRMAAMLIALAVCVPLYYLLKPFVRHNPASRAFLALVGAFSGLRITVVGKRPRGSAFLLANHVSWLDIPALAHVAGSAFIAHDGLADIGALRRLCEMNRTVFIARHDRTSVAAQIEQIGAAIDDGGALTLFPEGTTSDGTGLLAFKSSLLSALTPVPPGVAIYPVWLDYGPETADIAWVDEEPGTANFLRILARLTPLQLTVHILPELAGAQLENRKTMAASAQDAITQVMQNRAPARNQRVAL